MKRSRSDLGSARGDAELPTHQCPSLGLAGLIRRKGRCQYAWLQEVNVFLTVLPYALWSGKGEVDLKSRKQPSGTSLHSTVGNAWKLHEHFTRFLWKAGGQKTQQMSSRVSHFPTARTGHELHLSLSAQDIWKKKVSDLTEGSKCGENFPSKPAAGCTALKAKESLTQSQKQSLLGVSLWRTAACSPFLEMRNNWFLTPDF